MRDNTIGNIEKKFYKTRKWKAPAVWNLLGVTVVTRNSEGIRDLRQRGVRGTFYEKGNTLKRANVLYIIK